MEIRKTKKAVLHLTLVIATLLLGFAALRSVQAVAGFSAAPNAAVAITGAIYTTIDNGAAVNKNIFQTCTDVYMAGGPQNQNGAGLPPGTYYFQVTTPNGDLLSSDDAVCRQLTVNNNGVIAGAASDSGTCAHTNGAANNGNGATPVRLYPFNPTTNPGGEYKVWLVKKEAATIDADGKHLIFDKSDSKTDNFKSKGCPGQTAQYAIGGIKYNDANANGALDTDELGISGITIQVTLDDGKNTVVTTETNDKGEWALIFPVGTKYTACEMLPTDTTYTQTSPKEGDKVYYPGGVLAATAQSKCWSGTVADADLAGLNFGNVVCAQITCPANVTLECGADTGPENTGKATALCSGVDVTYKDSFAAACGNTGVITRTWMVKDGTGHTSSCDQTITIVDTTKPTISGVGGPLTIECPATPTFSSPKAYDNCGDATLTFSDVTTPGDCAGTYSITRTWTATDACNNSSTASQTITVVDKTPPDLKDNAGASGVIYCPTTPVFTPPTATDSCSTATVFVVSDVTSPGLCGTYSRTVTWGAKDACGNVSPLTRSQTLEVRCNSCGEGTIGFWQNKNGQDLIKSANQASLATYLTNYKPFQDLGTQVIATYVTNIVKSASAAGSSMNSMLKAQMLSTALDVYFNKVNGAANIDLTYINKPIGSTTYENVSSSFGGASCMSVKSLLLYAANQSNVGGTAWYGQVKSGPNSQELAKDTFDAINNQKAFSVFSCQ